MDNKKGGNFIWVLMVIILGMTLFKHFNFKTFRFKMPALDILFLIAFILGIYLIIKDLKKKTDK